ncbi:hypothetical protein GA0070216_10552 [Micromonospora matsumotoense]|uniref:YCII-related domain-containing protein n=1 Tax=Micromonospora matsumotoense TaxID=121616 RepID=A0A1C4XN18_9ACTN|nr:hypothetical protein [Micromonospora matsumotoense]SCF09939.1 hypothetical protein GA0070216_10552 [Micromonospora matsumotoense]
MYLVVGEQQMPAGTPEARRAQYAHMAEVVRQSPGFVRGWWGSDEADQEIGHALVVLDSREHALEFAATVARYVPDLRLRVVAVDVTASAP